MIVYAPINQACVTLGGVCVCVYVSCRLSSASLNRSKSDLKENRGDRKVLIYSSRPSLPPPPHSMHGVWLAGKQCVHTAPVTWVGLGDLVTCIYKGTMPDTRSIAVCCQLVLVFVLTTPYRCRCCCSSMGWL